MLPFADSLKRENMAEHSEKHNELRWYQQIAFVLLWGICRFFGFAPRWVRYYLLRPFVIAVLRLLRYRRKVIIENLPFLLSDTVGFIRKLPTDLVESFKSTLDEVREADLLLHVVDVSHPEFEEQIEVVEKTLADLKCGDKPLMVIFNKIDAFTYVQKEEDDLTPKTKENITLDELKETWMNKLADNCLFISAREKQNIENLKDIIYKKVCELHVQKYPYNDFLYQTYDEDVND